MEALATAIGEAARASTLAELGEAAFPALARALDACPVFFARADPDIRRSQAIAGEHRDALAVYLRQFIAEDPLGHVARAVRAPINLMHNHVDRRAVLESRAWHEFHRQHDFAHHMLVRFYGPELASPGALAMGFTRGRRQHGFAARDEGIAALVLPAFRGAALRIVRAALPVGPEIAIAAARHGLSRAEADVLARLALGLSNAEIAAALHVSIDTVKTHLTRVFRKLGVPSRARALVLLRQLA